MTNNTLLYYEGTVNALMDELYADTGQRGKAFESPKKSEGMFQEMGMDYWLARTKKVMERR